MSNYNYNEERAAQAAAIFTSLEGSTIDKYKLCKLMYYLERQTIVETGQPLFHDYLVSAPHGPVSSEVNHGIDAVVPNKNDNRDFQKGRHPAWEDNFVRVGRTNLHLTHEPSDDELSPADIKRIYRIHEKFKKWTFSELREFFHNLPEYEETESNIPIRFAEILRQEGVSEEEISELEEEYNYFLGVVNA